MPDPHLAAALLLHLELLQEAGIEALPAPGPGPGQVRPQPGTAVPADKAAALADVARRVAACTACPLAATRRRPVPGEGDPDARLVIVGEAPGGEEDATGRPFVGPAGQLLERILQGGMGLRRDQVFIANTLKCRPPGNRDPRPEEKAACRPFLDEQLAILRPDLVLALGRHAGNALLGRNAPLRALRGRVHPADAGRPAVLVTFHPAYLLRNPAAKRDCWQDIQLALRHLGMPIPSTGEGKHRGGEGR